MATINANVEVGTDAWIDLHDEAGITLGTSLLIQDSHWSSEADVTFIDSVTEPIGDASSSEGGYRTIHASEQVLSTPDIGERTWARRVSGKTGIVRVQTR